MSAVLDLGGGYYAEPAGGGAYRVYSPATLKHYLAAPVAGTCECPDAQIRKRACKHIALLRARMSDSENEKEVKMAEAKTEAAAQTAHVGPASPVSAIEVRDERLLTPVAGLDDLRAAVQKFIEIRDGLLDPGDVVATKQFAEVARTGWDKVALAFNVSVDVDRLDPIEVAGKPAFRARAVASTAPGRRATGHGICTLDEVQERQGKPDPRLAHFAAAIAESRAVKRALAGLTGGRDLTAEEIRAIQARKK